MIFCKRIILKIAILSIVNIIFISCFQNRVDSLLKEAGNIINQINILAISEDDSDKISTIAMMTRLMIISDELEIMRRNMSIKQIERYLSLLNEMNGISNPLTQQSTIMDITAPYIGRRPEIGVFTGIGPITTSTRDEVNHTVTVVMNIGYGINDSEAADELNSKQIELRNFVIQYFSDKFAYELLPENEERLKYEIMQIINTRFLEKSRVRVILFDRFDVIETF